VPPLPPPRSRHHAHLGRIRFGKKECCDRSKDFALDRIWISDLSSIILQLLTIISLEEPERHHFARAKCCVTATPHENGRRVGVTLQVSRSQVRYDDEDEDEGPQPDPMFEQGAPIPVRLHNEFPPELSSTPLEDIDSFYQNQRVSGIDALISLSLFEESRCRETISEWISQPFSNLPRDSVIASCDLTAARLWKFNAKHRWRIDR